MESTLTSNGQITLPKALRDDLHLKSGDKVVFERSEDGNYLLRPVLLRAASLKGILKDKYTGPPASIESMNRAIQERGGRDHR